MQQIADMSMTAGDWISLASLLCGTLLAVAVPVIGLLWRISTNVTVLARELKALVGDHAELSRRVDRLEPRVTRIETVIDERTDAGGTRTK